MLREATRAAGVAPNAAYRHFANHQALFDAVRAAALALLAQEMETEVNATRRMRDAGRRARAALRGVGVGYLRLAWQQPGLFRTAFAARPLGLQESASDDPAPRGAGGRDPFELLGDALDAMVAAGPAARPTAARARSSWPGRWPHGVPDD